jgi:2-polyprenyl-3-methyl-5-hydroxy-6-metoxy-1,4-benzoquinol methylase
MEINEVKPVMGSEYLDQCLACFGVNLEVLMPAFLSKVFVTGADEMSIELGVCGCTKCGLTFLNPRMKMATLVNYYTKQSRIPRTELNASSPFALLMESQIDFIANHKSIRGGMKVLEIGCAEGFFLESLNRRFHNDLVLYGVELSERYLLQASRILRQSSTLLATPIEIAEFGDVKFDLIVMRHVLERLTSPADTLKKLREILAPEGLLYIEVPDSHNIKPSLTSFYHHEHLLYFTIPVLNNHLKANGLSPMVSERFDANPDGSGFAYPVIRSLSGSGPHGQLELLPGHAHSTYLINIAQNDAAFVNLLKSARLRLRRAVSHNAKIGIFGAGPHTMEILRLLRDDDISWNKIFDNNPDKQGKLLLGIPIVKPDKVSLASVNCIFISSAEFEKEMVEQIHALVGSTIEIIRIYDNS